MKKFVNGFLAFIVLTSAALAQTELSYHCTGKNRNGEIIEASYENGRFSYGQQSEIELKVRSFRTIMSLTGITGSATNPTRAVGLVVNEAHRRGTLTIRTSTERGFQETAIPVTCNIF